MTKTLIKPLATTLTTLLVLGTLASSARADGGTVVEACGDWSLIEVDDGSYTLAEWFGGKPLAKLDRVSGELKAFGFKDLEVNRTTKTRVWIDDYLLTKRRGHEKLRKKCD